MNKTHEKHNRNLFDFLPLSIGERMRKSPKIVRKKSVKRGQKKDCVDQGAPVSPGRGPCSQDGPQRLSRTPESLASQNRTLGGPPWNSPRDDASQPQCPDFLKNDLGLDDEAPRQAVCEPHYPVHYQVHYPHFADIPRRVRVPIKKRPPGVILN